MPDETGQAPIDTSRPIIHNDDGSFSTERTITVEADGKQFLIPTIVGGRQLSNDEAIAAWRSGSNKPVGVFNSPAEAESAAVSRSAEIGRRRGPEANIDILAKVREKYPEYTSTDDTTLAVSLSQKFPEYRPYLRKYLTTYPVEAPATAASAAEDVTAADEKAVEDRFPDYGPFGVAKKGAELLGTPEMKAAIADMEGPNSRAAANLATGAAQWGLEQFTPGNVAVVAALGPVGKALPWLGRTAAGGFSAMMAWDAIKSVPGLYDLYQQGLKTGDMDEFQRQATKAGLSGAAAVLAGGHALKGPSLEAKLAKSEADLQKSKIALERASQEGDLASKQETHKNIKDAFGEGHEATETARRAVEQQQEVIDALNAATAPPTPPVVDEMRPRDLPETVGAAPPIVPGAKGTSTPAAVEGGAGGPVTAEEMASRPETRAPWQMSPKELDSHIAESSLSDHQKLVQALGEEGAKEFERLDRKRNSAVDREGADAAQKRIEEIDATLTPEQERLVYGMGETGLNVEELQHLRRVANMVDGDSPQSLGASMRWAMTKVDPRGELPGFDAPLEKQAAMAQIKRGFEIADEMGFDRNAVLQEALKAAGARFDPADADFMLRNYGKTAERPALPEAVQGANGEKVIPNQPPSPDAEAGLTTELSMRGVDTNDPQAVMDHLATSSDALTLENASPKFRELVERRWADWEEKTPAEQKKLLVRDRADSGRPDSTLDSPAKVRSVGDVPVSASYVGSKGYETDLADGAPSKVAHEATHMAAEEGKLPPPPEGPGANDQVVADTLTRKTGDPVGAFNRMAHTANQQLSDVASQIENTVFQTETVTSQMDRIAEKGTIAPEQREEFRQGDKPETFNLRVSQADVKHITGQLVEAMRNAKQLAVEVRFQGDPVSKTTAKLLDAQVRQADAKVQEVLKEWRTARYAAGRAVDQFQRHPELLDMLRSMGHTADELRNAQRRAPILSNILLKDFSKATPADKWQLAKDAMDYLRYTKFSATSFVMDITTDGWNLGAMLVGDIGGDLARGATGRLDFSNLRGFVRALDDRFTPYKDPKTGKWRIDRINPALREELGHTISGENIPGFATSGPGAFTYREGFGEGAMRSISRKVSKGIDYAIGGPMYAKGLVDQAAGEIAVSASLWQDAIKNTPKELRGAAAYQWRRAFVEKPPEANAKVALELGNKAKFNRPLSDLEEKIAGSTPYRLVADIYARWPFQFARALAENLGADPAALRGIVAAAKSGKGLDAAELTGKYLGKSLTGLGGVYFIYQSMKDKFDAKSAEYVKDDGNRIRLSGKQPVPEAMLLGYMIEGAWRTATQGKEAGEPYIAKALAVSQYTSIPFIHGFKGGLLTSFIDAYSDAQKNASFNPRGTERLIVDQINQAIPGGAVLGVLKSMSDDITREGVGANLPGVSLTLPEQPNSSTGEPLRLRQEMFGVNMPQMRGSPIPGATRILDPVTKLLMKYGQTVYRTNRSPIAGVPVNDLSPELQREWEFQLGQARTIVFHALTQGVNLDELPPEAARKLVAKQDALAAQLATKQIQIRYGIKPKPFREPTSRELTGPSELMERYNLAKQAREQALAEEQ